MPQVNNPNSFASSMPGQLAKTRRDLADLKSGSATSLFSIVIGLGGAVFNGVAQFLGGVTGPFNVTGAITASTTVTATGDLNGVNVNLSGFVFSPAGRAFTVVTSFVAAYFDGTGKLGVNASSRRYKQDIAKFTPDMQALFALQLVSFRYKEAVEATGAETAWEVGLIAEELHDLGLTWLVFYDEQGLPQGIAYERLALLLLPAMQDHERRLSAIEKALGL